jgi:hypothetical protein
MSFKFELDRLPGYSTADIVNEIRRVADLLAVAPRGKKEFDKESKVHSSTIIRRFGSWQEGLIAAERGHLYGGGPVTEKMRIQRGRDLGDEDLLAELRRLAQALDHNDLSLDDINCHSIVGESIFRRRFGTTRAAIERAGLTVRAQARRYTTDECFENLYDVWKHYGRRPHFSEINRPPSKVGGEAYIGRFGTWMKAQEIFLERMSAQPDRVPSPTPPAVSSECGPADGLIGLMNGNCVEKREIPLGLRFRVLSRDRFKCVLCGDHPAKNPDCDLHVDHIIPRSRGGRAEFSNLRTLCAPCNIGRGNRYDAEDQAT